ncbi:MAG TPA: hypothetical protein VIH95_03445 [Acidimicrobiales bacterium]
MTTETAAVPAARTYVDTDRYDTHPRVMPGQSLVAEALGRG